MDALQRYIPKVTSDQTFGETGKLQTANVQINHFHPVFNGGDQLTATIIKGSQRVLHAEDGTVLYKYLS